MRPPESKPMTSEALTRAVKTLAGKLQRVEQELVLTRESNVTEMTLAERLRKQADREIPFYYRLDIDLLSGATTRVDAGVLIEQQGAFLCNRIYFSWRPTAGANAGQWRPIAHSNPIIAVAAAPADVLDFQFEWTEGTAKRGRQNTAIPGDIFYRQDLDGMLQCPDVFIAASTVVFTVAPTVGPANNGTLSVTLEGVQLLSARP